MLSFPKFTFAFSCYTNVICTVFPDRRRELGDYLALSYGGSHFYTYHKLFSAKCAIHVAQQNQCPYWGALETELHNMVFLGVRNISCTFCRSVAYSTIECPIVTPSLPPPPTLPNQSTSSFPHLPTYRLASRFGWFGYSSCCPTFTMPLGCARTRVCSELGTLALTRVEYSGFG